MLQAVTSDRRAVELIFNYLESLPSTHVVKIIKKNKIFTSLFRLLFVKENVNEKSICLAKNLLYGIVCKGPLVSILNTFLESGKGEKMEIDEKPCVSDLIKPDKSISNEQEDLGVRLGKKLLEHNSEAEKTGLIVDWLSAVELEIVNLKQQTLQVSQISYHYNHYMLWENFSQKYMLLHIIQEN